MPVQRGRDSKGGFYRWGDHGAKYHYKTGSAISRADAHYKAAAQGRAIKASQTRAAR